MGTPHLSLTLGFPLGCANVDTFPTVSKSQFPHLESGTIAPASKVAVNVKMKGHVKHGIRSQVRTEGVFSVSFCVSICCCCCRHSLYYWSFQRKRVHFCCWVEPKVHKTVLQLGIFGPDLFFATFEQFLFFFTKKKFNHHNQIIFAHVDKMCIY